MNYTAVIRTLGTAGDKFQRLLTSLICQTLPPKAVLVYIADGYSIPKETIGVERYIYVEKGMLSQRAQLYEEVDTEYMLFLDDDLEFPPDTVQRMLSLLEENKADVISPDIFSNADRPLKSEVMMTLSGRMRARRNDSVWGYKVMRTAGYSYNKSPIKEVLQSETNAGACFLCRKKDFLRVNLRDELWVDAMPYPLGEDQVMYYKMYRLGLKQLTWYNHGFMHLDGGDNMTPTKEAKRLYGDVYFKIVFWHRFILKPERKTLLKIWSHISIAYMLAFTALSSLFRFRFDILKMKYTAIVDAVRFIKSEDYKSLPLI